MFRSQPDPRTTNAVAGHRQGGTVLCSILLHAGALAAVIIVQLGAITSPPVPRRLDAFVLPAVPTPPEPPPSSPPAPPALPSPVNTTAAPVQAPATLDLDPPVAPAPPRGMPQLGGVIAYRRGGTTVAGPPIRFEAPPPRSPDPVRPGSVITAPTRVAYVAPVYPPLARTARVEGIVVLEATIDRAGVVQNVRVLRSEPLLDAAAVDAVQQWRYTPTLLNGEPVAVIMAVTVRFTLR